MPGTKGSEECDVFIQGAVKPTCDDFLVYDTHEIEETEKDDYQQQNLYICTYNQKVISESYVAEGTEMELLVDEKMYRRIHEYLIED